MTRLVKPKTLKTSSRVASSVISFLPEMIAAYVDGVMRGPLVRIWCRNIENRSRGCPR